MSTVIFVVVFVTVMPLLPHFAHFFGLCTVV